MKKLILGSVSAIILSVLGAGCAEVDQKDAPIYSEETKSYRTPDEVIEIALQAAESFFNNPEDPQSRANSRRSVSSSLQVKVKYSDVASRSGESTPLYYVVNFDNEEGFAIVAANDSIDPIIAVTEQGCYYPGEPTEIAGFNDFMNGVESYLSSPASTDDFIPLKPYCYMDTVTYKVKRSTASWGQEGIEGVYCPNKIVGCGPTAAAIALAYCNYPESMTFTAPEIRGITVDFEWFKMGTHWNKRHNGEESRPCYQSDDIHNMIGYLTREIGYRCFADYRYDGTGTATNPIIIWKFLKNILPANTVTEEATFSQIDNIIDNGIAVIFAETSSGVGHAWIADGRLKYTITITIPQSPTVGDRDPVPPIVETRVKEYVHFNWGWSGEYNGYFEKGVFMPKKAYQFDNRYHDMRPDNFNYIFNVTGIKK